jgi:RES domain-containing protein
MEVWRLSLRRYPGIDGEGARAHGGRWNLPGTAVVYTSATLSLATLEHLANVDPDLLPHDLVSLSGDLPDHLSIRKIAAADLPANWRDYPAPEELKRIGTDWATSGQTLVLSVPSVVVPHERNYMLNPAHQHFGQIQWKQPSPFSLDSRLLELLRKEGRH